VHVLLDQVGVHSQNLRNVWMDQACRRR